MATTATPCSVISSFIYQGHPGRVVFGAGTLACLAAEAEKLGMTRALVISGPHQQASAAAMAESLGGRAVGVYPHAAMHTPIEVTNEALHRVTSLRIDGLVSIGGGSSIGLGKAIALRTGVPQIVLPTTYAGSEMTSILGETAGGEKTTMSDPRIRPAVVIYDVDLTLTLPPALSAVSGLNAMAHAIEALYAKDRNPIVSLMGLEAVKALHRALPSVVRSPLDTESRTEALYGAWLCGTCLGAVGMALHHKLCHTLGGAFGLPHAETHAVILPHALAYNAPAIPDVMHQLRPVLGLDPAQALYNLGERLGTARALRDLGMSHDGIERATALVLAKPYWNPRPIEFEGIRQLLARAWAGEPPAP